MQLDAKALAASTADIVKAHVAAATAPLLERIAALEARPLPERGEKGDRGDQGEPGRDGVGLAGALIDRSGVLVLTLADGTTRELGVVVGKDGEPGPQGERGEKGEPGEKGDKGDPGTDGAKGDPGEPGADGKDGADGVDGKDGRDGFSLDDFECAVADDDRTILLTFKSGQYQYEAALPFPTVIDRGVFKQGETYSAGDGVTWGGSFWIAQRATEAKPDSADSGWRLAVKRGRDGKDAKA